MRRPGKPWFALTLAVAGSLVMAGPAHASTAALQGDAIVVAAAPGETNTVTIGIQAAGIYVRDSGGVLTAGPGCTIDSSGEAACPRTGVARITVALGDGNDGESASASTGLDIPIDVDGGPGADQMKAMNAGATLNGGPGADVLVGGAGADHLIGGSGPDTLTGGDGADTIDAADAGYGDIVDCGPGNDSAGADPAIGAIPAEEALACETVTRPSLSVGGVFSGSDFTALPGVANDMTETMRPATLNTLVSDERGLVAASGCDYTVDGDLRTMLCDIRGGLDIDLGDGDDRFRGGLAAVTGGTGNDTVSLVASGSSVTGGPGNDTLAGDEGDDQTLDGGAGDDTISDRGGTGVLWGRAGRDVFRTRNGSRQDALCGPGRDRATVDWLDVVAACERYTRGDTTPRARAAATTRVSRLTTYLFQAPNGLFPKILVPVSCPRAAAAAGCRVSLAVYFNPERRADVPFRAEPLLIPAGTTRTVTLKGESFGLAGALTPRARVHTLIAIVTTDAALHTRTSLRQVTIIGSERRG